MRGEAGSTSSSPNAVDAGIAAAGATLATFPVIGPIIGAVLLLIAAVIIMIGQIIAKALEDQAAAKEGNQPEATKKDEAARKEKEDQADKVKKMQQRTTDEMARRDDCTLFGKKPD